MKVSLPPELESMVREKVRSKQYTSASEVMCEALRLLNERDSVRNAIPSGIGMNYDGPLIQSIFEDFLRRREQEASEQKKDAE